MKKLILFINLFFLSVLAFLSAGIFVRTHNVYTAPIGLSIGKQTAIICGVLASSYFPENVKDSQTYEHTAIPESNAGNGCMHQSGLGMNCLITGDKRRRLSKSQPAA